MSIQTALDVFNYWSGKRANKASLKYQGNQQILEFAGPDFQSESAPFSGDPHDQAKVMGLMEKHQVLANVEKALRMPVTGNLAQTIRDRVAKAKERSAQAQNKVSGALDQIDGATISAEQFANDLAKEAADLHASLGGISNGPPTK